MFFVGDPPPADFHLLAGKYYKLRRRWTANASFEAPFLVAGLGFHRHRMSPVTSKGVTVYIYIYISRS